MKFFVFNSARSGGIRAITIACAVLAAVSFAGCGGGNGSNAPASSAPVSSAAASSGSTTETSSDAFIGTWTTGEKSNPIFPTKMQFSPNGTALFFQTIPVPGTRVNAHRTDKIKWRHIAGGKIRIIYVGGSAADATPEVTGDELDFVVDDGAGGTTTQVYERVKK